MKLDLPSGGWAELRDDVDSLRARDKKEVLRHIKDDSVTNAANGLDTVDGVVCMMVTAWELPYLPGAVLPKQAPEILDELTIPDYDLLIEAVTPAVKVLFPKGVTPDDHQDPASPTRPAGASGRG